MIDFFRDAPPAAVALMILGVALLALEIPMRIRWSRRASQVSAGPAQDDSRPFLPLMMTSAGWGLLAAGLGWNVLAS